MATATKAAIAEHRLELEEARRLAALQVATLAHAVTSVDDQVGWTRLTELGTTSTVRAQEAGVTSTVNMLNRTLEAVDMVGDLAARLPGIEPGRLASGRPVVGMFAKTQNIVQARMAGGATFPEGLDASANVLTAIASSEPHRIARDGPFNVGLTDNRFNRYRRVAVGVTCAFCRMLATRGAVYLTPESAGRGRQYHYKCDCYVELVADPAAIERSKAEGAERWRQMQADSATAWRPGGSTTRAFTPNPAAVAGTPERAASLRRQRDILVKQRADGTLTPWGEQRIADIDAELATGEFAGTTKAAPSTPAVRTAPVTDVPSPTPAAVARREFDADTVKRITNADLESEVKAAWNVEDWDRADILEAELERRQRWADGWGRDFDEYDDWRPLEPTARDADLPSFEAIPDPPKMSRRQIRAEWEVEQDHRYWKAEAAGAAIRPELRAEAARKGITLDTLMKGDPRTAYKYANQELLDWWADPLNNGRMPLWEREAAHGLLDKRTSPAQRALTEDRARARAARLRGRDYAEGVARLEAERRAETARRSW